MVCMIWSLWHMRYMDEWTIAKEPPSHHVGKVDERLQGELVEALVRSMSGMMAHM